MSNEGSRLWRVLYSGLLRLHRSALALWGPFPRQVIGTILEAPPVPIDQLLKLGRDLDPAERRALSCIDQVVELPSKHPLFKRGTLFTRCYLSAETIERFGLVGGANVSAEQLFREVRDLLMAGFPYRKGVRSICTWESHQVGRSYYCFWEWTKGEECLRFVRTGRWRSRARAVFLCMAGWKRASGSS